MVATVISVALMIITLALANGFTDAVSQKVFSFWGHIRIQEKQPEKSVLTEETPILKNDSLVDIIKQNTNVKTIHPFATKYAILKTKDELEGVLVKGFDSTYDFNHFKPFANFTSSRHSNKNTHRIAFFQKPRNGGHHIRFYFLDVLTYFLNRFAKINGNTIILV